MTRFRSYVAAAGFAVAVIGLVLDDSRVVWGAIALLAIAFVMRLVARRRERDASD